MVRDQSLEIAALKAATLKDAKKALIEDYFFVNEEQISFEN